MQSRLQQFLRDTSGASAVEFVLVFPATATLIFGIIHLCTFLYASSNLKWAAEQAARCAAVSQLNTSLSCTTTTSTQTYAASIYHGPQIAPSFTASEDSSNTCRKVAGSGTYTVSLGYLNFSVPLAATACFPATIDPSSPWT